MGFSLRFSFPQAKGGGGWRGWNWLGEGKKYQSGKGPVEVWEATEEEKKFEGLGGGGHSVGEEEDGKKNGGLAVAFGSRRRKMLGFFFFLVFLVPSPKITK